YGSMPRRPPVRRAHPRANHGCNGHDPGGRGPAAARFGLMSELALYRRLLRQARPYWLHLAGLFGIGLLASPLALLDPVPLKIVFDSVLGSHPLPVYVRAVLPSAVLGSAGALLVAIGLLLGVAALTQLQALANRFMQAYVGERLVLGLRTQLVQHAQRPSLSYHDSKGSADSLYRIQQDAAVIDKIMVEGIVPFVAAAVTLAMMIVVTLRLDWQLALVALGVSPPLFMLSRLYRPRMRRQSRQVKKLESSALAVVQETLGALRVVKAFGLLDEQPEVPERPNARPIGRARGAVAFRHVSFAYGPDRPVLHDVSCDIAPGTRLGIVGATGAGKTTLISLLTRFYDPTEGQ